MLGFEPTWAQFQIIRMVLRPPLSYCCKHPNGMSYGPYQILPIRVAKPPMYLCLHQPRWSYPTLREAEIAEGLLSFLRVLELVHELHVRMKVRRTYPLPRAVHTVTSLLVELHFVVGVRITWFSFAT